MGLNPALVNKCKKMGVILAEDSDQPNHRRFMVHWPKVNVRVYGPDQKWLVKDIEAIIDMETNYPSMSWDVMDDDTCAIEIETIEFGISGLRANAAFPKAKEAWLASRAELWEDAEEGDVEPEERNKSVVSSRYRARYTEAGHPTHCGDWLAEQLISRTTNKKGIEIEMFEAICLANGVNLSKYNRTTHGWQGRLRMTGRNLLARVVFEEGRLLVPSDYANPTEDPISVEPSTEWMQAQRFKRSQ